MLGWERRSLFFGCCLCVVAVLCSSMVKAAPDDFEAQRQAMLDRQRRVLFNNDGAEVFLFPADREITAENVLDIRTTALAGSHVDTIFYNPSTPSFGMVTHYSEIFDMRGYYEQRHRRDNKVNATWPLIEQGNDSVELMVQFCRNNDMELFLSLRMNDTHDAGRERPGRPNPTFSPIKRKHPEYLVGRYDKRPPYGRWSAVDYSLPEVRNLAYQYLEEVCQNYDVDGIELDFFRHAMVFGSVTWGGKATEEERDLMTGLIRRVREMTQREGRKRGRPILVAMRVPDSVEYSRAAGLDIERWLEEGLVDILVGSGYFKLNHWDYLVELGHRYGAKVYPCLSESRLGGTDIPPFSRSRYEARRNYRARASQVWASGADGVYLFNFFDAEAPMLHEIGEPEVLAGLDKTYFVTVRNRRGAPSRWLSGGDAYCNVPILSPRDPVLIAKGQEREIELHIGDNLSDAIEQGLRPRAACYVRGDFDDNLPVSFNGVNLSERSKEGPWLKLPLPTNLVRQGVNHFRLTPQEELATGFSPWVSGRETGALSFENDGHVQVSGMPELRSTTWAAWIKQTKLNSYASIISATFEGAGAGHILDIDRASSGAIPRVVWNHGVKRTDLRAETPLPRGEWAHIAMTFDAGSQQLKLYVNGDLKDSAECVSTTPFSKLNLGRRLASRSHHFTGLMEEVRIYERALRNIEVQALMDETTDAAQVDLQQGLVAHWPLNEKSGRVARDASGHGHDANLTFDWITVSDLVVSVEFGKE